MPEEVTYATLKFPNPSQTKKLQDSSSLKRTDNQKVPELELGSETGNGTEGAERTVEAVESTAMRGHSAPSKTWCSVAFISLTLNLVVLAGLGTLGLMNLGFHSCSESWMCHGDRGRNFSCLMNMDNKKNWVGTKLFIIWLSSPVSWMDLNCTLNTRNQTAENGSKFCILNCLAPP
ncbi:uncharacterized protein [Equus caballus]|uniref:uncharacterized protein n=1 Tax=Equus caballus TaxID=9796 RepID=UPI0038B371D9